MHHTLVPRWLVLAIVVLAGGCARGGNGDALPLAPPFDETTGLGAVTAAWRPTGEARSFAGGARLAETEVQLQYRVDAQNSAGEKVFVRLEQFGLVDEAGLRLASDDARTACILGAGAAEGVLRGTVWLKQGAVDAVEGFRISRFAVPLGKDGRARLRAWLLQGRAGEAAIVEAEIARYAAAPACAG